MSQFSNRRSSSDGEVAGHRDAAEDPQRAYIQALLGLLGDSDPPKVLQATPPWLEGIVRELPAAHLHAPEAPGKWSIAGVIAHLADSEIVWGFRLRMVLAEERPLLAGYDQDLWAHAFEYSHPDVDRALRIFSTLRESHLALLQGLRESDWERVAMHAERGEESVRHMMRLYAGHDLVHQRQIERIRAAFGV